MTERLFADYLRELHRGQIHEELSGRFRELIQAVSETGRAGSLTLKLTVKPTGGIDSETVALGVSIKAVPPEPERHAALYFVTPEFNLSRRDPRQGDFEEHLETIEGGKPS